MTQGWVCPKCGRVYAPMHPACNWCNNQIPTYSTKTIYNTVTYYAPNTSGEQA